MIVDLKDKFEMSMWIKVLNAFFVTGFTGLMFKLQKF